MLSVNITIKNIDYEKTLEGIFPVLKKKLAEKESDNMIIRLFQKLDDDALQIALDIMNRLPNETKTELMVQILNTYSGMVKDKLNEKLSEHYIGKNLHVGEVSVVNRDGVLYLWIGQINADYKNLLKEKIPGNFSLLGKWAMSHFGEKLEQTAIDLLWNDVNKQGLIALSRDVLNQYGIVLELEDIELMKDTSEAATESASEVIWVENHLQLNAEMEEQILDALAGYLKDSVKRNEEGM